MLKLHKNNEKYIQKFKEYITQEISALQQNQMELWEIKNTTEQIKNLLEKTIIEWVRQKKRMLEPEDTSCENAQSEMWKRNWLKLKNLKSKN